MTGNIGEWSELYAFFKLLSDGRLYAADENTNRIPEIYYDIIKIIRAQNSGSFEYLRKSEIKVICAETGDEICSVPMHAFVEQTEKLLEGIKGHKNRKGAFELPEIWQFAESINCSSLKAKSTDKSDIHLMVHDIMSGRDDTFGFSIKSQLGAPSTLFNASGATNFIYRITSRTLTYDEIITFNNLNRFKEKFKYLNSLGAEPVFFKVENDTLDFNLKMVTSEMPDIFAEMIKFYYQGKASSVPELTDMVSSSGVVSTLDNRVYCSHNVKEMLTNIALGMVPNTMWIGNYEATGGFIIVKEDGNVVCYHIYNRNSFKNYIFAATRFDTPSQSKHGFGKIYEENGEQWLKLNVQIRFAK
ncbi:MAG: HpaII family restriction endonuclease [Butyrivibrio sp.]|nr:HpaII family restriction endonuclease [Butyrivibrio sp.]